jgi:hypothetical protein
VAPEGGALAGPSASPHFPVVGGGNPVAVPCLGRLRAKRAGIAIRAIRSCRESHVHRALKKVCFVRYPLQDLPIGLSDLFFKTRYYYDTVRYKGVGLVSSVVCEREEGTDG